jgi:hypothetical protein
MNLLFHKITTSDHAEATQQVDMLIRENTVLVWVTKEEHGMLNKQYQCTMPVGFDTYPWKDKLARYTQTSGVSGLSRWQKEDAQSKPAEDDLDSEMESDF